MQKSKHHSMSYLESIPISDCIKYEDITCQAIFGCFDTIKSCIVLVYIPPISPEKSFIDLIESISHCMMGINDDSYELNLVGDFNFPDIDWETSTVLPGDTKDLKSHANSQSCYLVSSQRTF